MTTLRRRAQSSVSAPILFAFAIGGTLLLAHDARSAPATAGPVITPAPIAPAPPRLPPVLKVPMVPTIVGWADLHTHPMSNLAFGGQIFWGGPDEQALLAMNSQCQPMRRATDQVSAMGPENSCNNLLRQQIVKMVQGQGVVTGDTSMGAPLFQQWPKWNDVAHQKMWFEWIDRARKYGGLRVMVGLSHNNMALAKATAGAAPQTDKESSELQIKEMKDFVLRHNDVMQVALDPAQVYTIASSGRIAVILGVELDNLGNGAWGVPGKTPQQVVTDEIQNLYDHGVRYVFPIHLTDNQFGGTAIYDTTFVTANIAQNGGIWDVECTPCADEIGMRLPTDLSTPVNVMQGLGLAPQTKRIADCMPMNGCGHRPGHRNVRGLTPLGEHAIKELMRRGMIIDIDHMSQKSAERALQIAETMVKNGGYPMMSGHTGLRNGSVAHRDAENSRTASQMQRIAALGGMVGQGTDGAEAFAWASDYLDIVKLMGNRPGSVAIGTDMNSLLHAPRPSGRVMAYTPERAPGAEQPGDFPKAISTAKGPHRSWDYMMEGVVNYGMMADFIRDLRAAPGKGGVNGQGLVDNELMKSADYFWHMWERCQAQKVNVQ